MKYIWIFSAFFCQQVCAQAQSLCLEKIGDYSIQLEEKSCLWQLLDAQGKSLLPDKDIQKIYFVSPNLIYVQNGFTPKYYLLLQDKWQALAYQKVELLDDNMLLVSSGKKQGVISTSGEGLLPIQYQTILPFQKHFLIKNAEAWHLWDKHKRKITFSFPAAPWFLDIFGKGSMANFLYFATGEAQFARLKLEDLSLEQFDLTLTQYLTQGLWTMVPKTAELIQLKAIDAQYFIIQKGEKYGLLHESRALALPTQYNNIFCDENYPNLLHVQEGGNWGVYSVVLNQWLIPIHDKQHVPYFIFNENTFGKKEKQDILIFSSQKEQLSLKADVYKVLNAHYFAFALDNKWGIYDLRSGKIAISPQYKAIAALPNDLFKVEEATNTAFIVNLSNKKIACWK